MENFGEFRKEMLKTARNGGKMNSIYIIQSHMGKILSGTLTKCTRKKCDELYSLLLEIGAIKAFECDSSRSMDKLEEFDENSNDLNAKTPVVFESEKAHMSNFLENLKNSLVFAETAGIREALRQLNIKICDVESRRESSWREQINQYESIKSMIRMVEKAVQKSIDNADLHLWKRRSKEERDTKRENNSFSQLWSTNNNSFNISQVPQNKYSIAKDNKNSNVSKKSEEGRFLPLWGNRSYDKMKILGKNNRMIDNFEHGGRLYSNKKKRKIITKKQGTDKNLFLELWGKNRAYKLEEKPSIKNGGNHLETKGLEDNLLEVCVDPEIIVID